MFHDVGLVDGLLAAGPTFDVSVTDLASRFDIQQLVARTLLTYLELLGVLRQGTPFYGTYEAKLLTSMQALLAPFSDEARRFLQAVFAAAKEGRTWYQVEPARVAVQLGVERERVGRALLTSYFGEQLPGPCGHCSFCETGQAGVLGAEPTPAPIKSVLDLAEFDRLRQEKASALGQPRQQARFLCGINSPALSQARLGSHALFGILGAHRFADVLAWCAEGSGRGVDA